MASSASLSKPCRLEPCALGAELIPSCSLCPLCLDQYGSLDPNADVRQPAAHRLRRRRRAQRNLPRPPHRHPAQRAGRRLRRHRERRLDLFYGLVTDLQLGATDQRFADEQSEHAPPAGHRQGPARADPVHQPGSPAGPDAGARPRARLAGIRRTGRASSQRSGAAGPVRSRPSRRTMPGSAWPARATSPRSSARPAKAAISSSATPASRATRSASTWISSSSAPRACSAPPAPANPS